MSKTGLAVSTISFGVMMERLLAIERQLKRAQEMLQLVDYEVDRPLYANFRAGMDAAKNALKYTWRR